MPSTWGITALKVAIIVGALLVFFERLNSSANLVKSEAMESSTLYEPIKEIGDFVFSAVLRKNENSEIEEE